MFPGGDGFPRGPGRGQFLRPGPGQGDLRGGGGGGAGGRHPHAFHAGDGSGSRSAHGPKRGSLHRRSLPLHAHRRGHRAGDAGLRHLRPGQGHRRADGFSHAKRTRQRPGARSDRGIGAFLARELYAALDRRHHQSRRLGGDGGLPGNRGCAGARLGEVDERCLAAGNRFQGSRRERGRRLRDLAL